MGIINNLGFKKNPEEPKKESITINPNSLNQPKEQEKIDQKEVHQEVKPFYFLKASELVSVNPTIFNYVIESNVPLRPGWVSMEELE